MVDIHFANQYIQTLAVGFEITYSSIRTLLMYTFWGRTRHDLLARRNRPDNVAMARALLLGKSL